MTKFSNIITGAVLLAVLSSCSFGVTLGYRMGITGSYPSTISVVSCPQDTP